MSAIEAAHLLVIVVLVYRVAVVNYGQPITLCSSAVSRLLNVAPPLAREETGESCSAVAQYLELPVYTMNDVHQVVERGAPVERSRRKNQALTYEAHIY